MTKVHMPTYLASFISANQKREDLLVSMIKDLAKRWKSLLKKTDAKLGIDSKYTRPGILVFLDTFKKRMEDADSYGDEKIAFNFQ